MTLKFSDQSDGIITAFFHWNLLGLWFENKPKLYFVYAFILHCVFNLCYALSMFLSVFVGENLASKTATVYQSLSDVSIILKTILATLLQNRYRELYKTLYSDLKMLNDDDVYEKQMIQRGRNRSKRLLYTMICVYYTSVIALMFKPLLSTEQVLPFKTVYPFVWEGTTYVYCAAYIYQFIGIVLQVTLSAGFDTIPCSVMILLCEYCEAISYNMKNLGRNEFSNTDQKRYEIMKRITQNYVTMNRILKILAKGFSVIIFIQFCFSTIVVCTTAFQITIVKFSDEKGEYIFMISYMISMLIQIFIPCYYGNQLYLTSTSLTDSLFNSNWIYFDNKFKKNIILFMEFIKKPMILLGGGIIQLKLSAFLATINFAYSIYNLLNRMQYQPA